MRVSPSACSARTPVHEIQKLLPSATLVVPGLDLSAGHVERRKECAGAVARVFKSKPAGALPLSQTQPALRPLQGLAVRLLPAFFW